MRADRDRVHHLYLKRVEADNDKGFEPVDEAGIPSYLSNAARCVRALPFPVI